MPPPTVTLTFDPPGPDFPISVEAAMPAVTATAKLENVPAPPPGGPPAIVQYEWKATLSFSGAGCAHAAGTKTDHPEMKESGYNSTWKLPFSQVRGGELTVTVTARQGSVSATATSKSLRVVGTNPTVGALQAALVPSDGFKRLMRLESGLRQFLSPACPLFSQDGKGGVGICQITYPKPTADEIWSWKENLKAGLKLYKEKEAIARGYPKKYEKSQEFKDLVDALNKDRAKRSTKEKPLAALTVRVPEYTKDELEHDAIRAFNGFAGGVHEYRVKVDAAGLLVVKEDGGGTTASAEWERISAKDRIAIYDKLGIPASNRGDPDYVEDVFKQATF